MKYYENFVMFIGGIIILIAILAVPAIPLWQVYNYLRYGVWEEISCLTILEYLNFKTTWINEPQSWFGLHSILDWLHGSVMIFFFILLCTFSIALLDSDKIIDKEKRKSASD